MTKKQREKTAVIHGLLRNGTYTPSSKVYQNLQRALGKLSYNDLSNLRLLSNFKEAAGKQEYYRRGLEAAASPPSK